MARFANNGDLNFLKTAWDVCFDDPQEFIGWNFENNYSPSDTIIAEADGKPASNMQLMPHRIRLRGREYNINYVSGVATLPEFRHRGLVRELFAFAFKEMQRRSQPFSLLVPFNYEFYEKFGYRQCYTKIFRHTDSLCGENLRTETGLNPTLITELDRIYKTETADKNGYAVRSSADWQKILEDLLLISKGRVIIHSGKNGQDGYALVTDDPKGGFELHEVCGNCGLTFNAEEKPFAMARIIDPVRLLGDMAEDFDGELDIKITDDLIKENNVTLHIGGGKAVPCEKYGIETDIKDLAQMIFGFGKDRPEKGLFSSQNNYLNMIF